MSTPSLRLLKGYRRCCRGALALIAELRRSLQHQTIADRFLGGEAGTGKSTVVDALLTMVKQWGREGSVKTMAFTGAAAINIHGKRCTVPATSS